MWEPQELFDFERSDRVAQDVTYIRCVPIEASEFIWQRLQYIQEAYIHSRKCDSFKLSLLCRIAP
jgi:hypothetical protein